MNIVVSFQQKYGKELFYPKSEDAVFLAKFIGRPTLGKDQLKMALNRGWDVTLFKEEINLSDFLKEKNEK